jgi:hypothetical protein
LKKDRTELPRPYERLDGKAKLPPELVFDLSGQISVVELLLDRVPESIPDVRR